MDSHPPQSRQPWRAAACLYAGVFLNSGLLEWLAPNRDLVGNLPALMVSLLLCGLFLGFAVLYVPARLGLDFEAAVRALMGPYAAWAAKLLLLVWAAAWFSYSSGTALTLMDQALVRRGPPIALEESPGRMLLLGLFWLAMIFPSAAGTRGQLARAAVFTTKVSFCVIAGLAVAARGTIPEMVERFSQTPSYWARDPWPLLLLWGAPPLLAAAYPSASRGTALRLAAAGVVVPVLFSVTAGLLTVAGAASISVAHWKLPSYLAYARMQPNQLGWVKVLALGFTFLTASRLAAHVAAGALGPQPSLGRGAAATLLLLTGTFAIWKSGLFYDGWVVPAIPFAPLAGVLCGVYAARRGAMPATPERPGMLAAAWLAGCLVTWLPRRIDDNLTAWVVPGWAAAFFLSYRAARSRMSGRRNTAPPASTVIDGQPGT